MTETDKANSSAGAETEALTGKLARRMLEGASIWLTRNAAAIDAINVFPVPDGDTGSNMALTMQAAVERLSEGGRETAAEELRLAARGALLGARGNSGVILSQWLHGLAESLAESLAGPKRDDVGALNQALEHAAEAARGAVVDPKEGTILSVASAVGNAVRAESIVALMEAGLGRAQLAVERTPEQMPLLREAGVVDAGALGLAIVWEGMLFGVRGLDPPQVPVEAGAIDPGWLVQAGQTSEAGFGFCTEFVVTGEGLEAEALRVAMSEVGSSVGVVGDPSMLHVHVHTGAPESAFARAAVFGAVSGRKADDMSAQHAGLLAETRHELPELAVVAVASGEGFMQLFHDLGVAAVVAGGPTMNPSAAAILQAATTTHAREVIVLANDTNIVPAAELAARLAAAEAGSPRIRVVASADQPGGVAALSALEQGGDAAGNARRMSGAAARLVSGFVTRAARAIKQPVALREGQSFAALDGTIVEGTDDDAGALIALVRAMLKRQTDAALLTLYQGIDVDPDEAAATEREVEAVVGEEIEVELVIGGQPHYPWLASLE